MLRPPVRRLTDESFKRVIRQFETICEQHGIPSAGKVYRMGEPNHRIAWKLANDLYEHLKRGLQTSDVKVYVEIRREWHAVITNISSLSELDAYHLADSLLETAFAMVNSGTIIFEGGRRQWTDT